MIATDQEYIKAFAVRRSLQKAIKAAKGEDILVSIWREKCDNLTRDIEQYDLDTKSGEREGDWMPTFSGRRFWFHDPRPGDIDIEDIAQALSRISRYNGMTLGTIGYTVAQHSFLASQLAKPGYELAALMHDAPEAYAGDVITPLKRILGKSYEVVEDRIMNAVSRRYKFDWGEETQAEVKRVDQAMLATEVRDLLPYGMIKMSIEQEPQPFFINVWTQEESKKWFMERFMALTDNDSLPCL